MQKQKGYIITILMLVSISAVAIDVSIPVLTIVTDYFNVDSSKAQFIVSTYLAGYGIGMIPAGICSDRFGRIPVIYIGIIVYIASGFLSAYAPTFEMVLWSRFIQGLGGAVGPTVARAIARDIASGKELGKLMSVIVSAIAIAALISPVLGSFLYSLYDWRSTFLISPILGSVILIMMFITSYETYTNHTQGTKILSQFSTSLRAFFQSKISIWSSVVATVGFSGYQVIIASISLLMVDIYELDPSYVGLLFGLSLFFYVLAAYFNKKRVNIRHPIKLLGYGVLLFLISGIGLLGCYYINTPSFWLIWIFITFYVTGLGFLLPNTSTIAMDPLPKTAGFASSILGTMMMLGASVMIIVSSSIYDKSIISISCIPIVCSLVTAIIYYLRKPILKIIL